MSFIFILNEICSILLHTGTLMTSLIPHISETNYQLNFKICSRAMQNSVSKSRDQKTRSLRFNLFVWKWLVLISVCIGAKLSKAEHGARSQPWSGILPSSFFRACTRVARASKNTRVEFGVLLSLRLRLFHGGLKEVRSCERERERECGRCKERERERKRQRETERERVEKERERESREIRVAARG